MDFQASRRETGGESKAIGAIFSRRIYKHCSLERWNREDWEVGFFDFLGKLVRSI